MKLASAHPQRVRIPGVRSGMCARAYTERRETKAALLQFPVKPLVLHRAPAFRRRPWRRPAGHNDANQYAHAARARTRARAHARTQRERRRGEKKAGAFQVNETATLKRTRVLPPAMAPLAPPGMVTSADRRSQQLVGGRVVS